MLVAGRFWREQKSKPYQLGLWWGTWLGTFSVMAVGLRFGELGFAEVFFRILASVPIFFGIGFIAGFIFRKLKPIAGGLKVAANTPSSLKFHRTVHPHTTSKIYIPPGVKHFENEGGPFLYRGGTPPLVQCFTPPP